MRGLRGLRRVDCLLFGVLEELRDPLQESCLPVLLQ